MQTNDLTAEKLRELADLKPDNARVLSLFVNLDPRDFGTPPARASEIRSLIDQASRTVKELQNDGLSQEEKKALVEDVERVRSYLNTGDFDAKGAHGIAVYASGPADLFEVIKLPRPVQSNVVVDDSPFIEPIADLGSRTRWMVLLVSRSNGRILRGTADGLREVDTHWDDVHGKHSQGGWSQARYQRSVEEEAKNHVQATADVLFEHFKRASFDKLLIGCKEELYPDVKSALHNYVGERLVGRFDVDIENTAVDDIFKIALPKMEAYEEQREKEALDRLQEGVGAGGRGVGGIDDTLNALNERRVEKLLVNYGYTTNGSVCPQCGSVWADGISECPADGAETVRRDDVIESAIELALSQSADVHVVRYDGPRIESFGQIGAVLRF
jgi:peptide subunit release factor 1 (eRF1)